MHTLSALYAKESELTEGATAPPTPTPQPPSSIHSGLNEAALIFVVWVCVPLGIKRRTQEGRGWIMYVVWSHRARVHVAPRYMHAEHLLSRH